MADKKVMIVEDDMRHMKLFHDVLETQGYDTLRNTNGDGVVEMAREYRPDLILLDIRLPYISGLEIIRQFKDAPDLKDIPVIAVTAMANDWDRDEYMRRGFDGFMTKPIAIPNFVRTIAKFLSPAPYIVREYA
ncbi:MAG: response regulator [Rhodospirillales bacterium]|nr:response regulator [Rhodospirillales bacterium]